MSNSLDLKQIPEDLTEESKEFWHSVTKDYKMDTYLYANLHMALLARQQAMILLKELKTEGYCVTTARGVRSNPKAGILNQMMSQFYKGLKQAGIEIKD